MDLYAQAPGANLLTVGGTVIVHVGKSVASKKDVAPINANERCHIILNKVN